MSVSRSNKSELTDNPSTSNNQPVDWNVLPVELWLEIFKRCPQMTIIFTLRNVCCLFRSLSLNPALWKKVDLNKWKESIMSEIMLDENCTVVQKPTFSVSQNLTSTELYRSIMPYLVNFVQRITFSQYYKDFTLASTELGLLCQCINLSHLNMGFCENVNAYSLQEICRNCPKIKILVVEGCRNVDDICMKAVSELPLLTTLNISHCADVSDHGLRYLSSMSSSLLHFVGDGVLHITNSGVYSLVESHPKLETLILDGEKLNDISIEAASFCLENLQVFHVSFCTELTDRSIIALYGKKKLKKLFLKKLSCEIKINALEGLLMLDTLANLVELTLTDSDAIVDSTAHLLSNRCRQLTLLNLNWCCLLTDEGIMKITNHCSHLVQLHLVGLPLLQGSWIPNLENKLPNLRFLDLSVCNMIMDVDVIDLVQRKTDLTAYSYYHEEVVYRKDLKLYRVYKSKNPSDTKSNESNNSSPECAGSRGALVDF
uniref:F-box domain-containing protein n=1 Tax=Ciona savignyi TaxID=51511 RepID=H2YQM8_CIOSA